jgi:hypothetical protein
LFLRAKSEAANIYCNALACTPWAMLYLTASVDGIVVGFDGAIQPRLRNVVGMVFAGAFLKFSYAPRERRRRNTYLCRFGYSRHRRWRRDFCLPPPHISPVVVWDVESHEMALSSEPSVTLVD